MNNEKKIIIFILIILFSVSVILAGGFYYFFKKIINQEKIANLINFENKTKFLQERNKSKKYYYCQAGLKNDYKICNFFPVKGEKKICYKIVGFKNIFLSLAKKRKIDQKIVSNFNLYVNNYLTFDSMVKKFILSKKLFCIADGSSTITFNPPSFCHSSLIILYDFII